LGWGCREVAGATCWGSGALSATGVPQFRQKRSPSSTGFPHLGQSIGILLSVLSKHPPGEDVYNSITENSTECNKGAFWGSLGLLAVGLRCLLIYVVVTKAYLKTGIYLVLIAFALGGAYVFEESFNASNMALTDGASFVNFLIVSSSALLLARRN
jgi:hypothetical protein